MLERYQPNGEPLTEREAEIIDLLIEEASEVIHAASKLKRFGRENVFPTHPKVTNSQTLGLELGDLSLLIDIALGDGLVVLEDLQDGAARKAERLPIFSKYLP